MNSGVSVCVASERGDGASYPRSHFCIDPLLCYSTSPPTKNHLNVNIFRASEWVQFWIDLVAGTTTTLKGCTLVATISIKAKSDTHV
jgi:hypothetical protein